MTVRSKANYLLYYDDGSTRYIGKNNRNEKYIQSDTTDAAAVLNAIYTDITSNYATGASIECSDDIFTLNQTVNMVRYTKLVANRQRLTNTNTGPRFVRGAGLTSGYMFTHSDIATTNFTASLFQGLSLDGVDQNTLSSGVGGIQANFDFCNVL